MSKPLRFLLDEHLSPKVAEICGEKCAISLHHWKNGALVGESDERILQAAAGEKFVLVTFDVNTIPSLLRDMAIQGESHTGVSFISTRSFAQNDSSGIASALLRLSENTKRESWLNRFVFLTKKQ